MKTDKQNSVPEIDFIPSRVNPNRDPVVELRRIIMEWVNREKVAALDEWVSIPFTVLPIPIFLLILVFQGKTALITSVSLGLTLVFWVAYKIAKAKRAVDIRFFVIAYFFQSLVYLAFFAVFFTIISLPTLDLDVRFPFETIFKVEIAIMATLPLPFIMNQWGYGPCRVVKKCWNMIAKNIEYSRLDSWNHRDGIQRQIKLGACQLCKAMMRPGLVIAFSLLITILLLVTPEPDPIEVLTLTVMFLSLTMAGIYLSLRHVWLSQQKAANQLQNIATHLDLFHNILESQRCKK